MASRLKLYGFWSGIVLAILGLVYLCFVAFMVVSGSGFPPVDPFLTMINILILLTAVWMVLFWTILHQALPVQKKLFSQASLGMILIFAALTCINRYVGLTVVKQALSSGNTPGLQWFLPYSWPSVMLALEFLGWGFFFGIACLCLAPAFTKGRLERTISWVLVATGILSLTAVLGQVISASSTSFSLCTVAGVLAWGPGLTTLAVMVAIWHRRREGLPISNLDIQ
jgi:hypothetical protein